MSEIIMLVISAVMPIAFLIFYFNLEKIAVYFVSVSFDDNNTKKRIKRVNRFLVECSLKTVESLSKKQICNLSLIETEKISSFSSIFLDVIAVAAAIYAAVITLQGNRDLFPFVMISLFEFSLFYALLVNRYNALKNQYYKILLTYCDD